MWGIVAAVVMGGLIVTWLAKPQREALMRQLQQQNTLLAEHNEVARQRYLLEQHTVCLNEGHDWEWEHGDAGFCSRCRIDYEQWADEQCRKLDHVWVDEDGDELDSCDRCGTSKHCAVEGHRWEYKYMYLHSVGRFEGQRWCEPCERLEYESELPLGAEPWHPPSDLVARVREAQAAGQLDREIS